MHVSVGVVAPTEGDGVAVESEQSMIGDGDAVSVTAEITEHVFGTAEGGFGVNNPWVPV